MAALLQVLEPSPEQAVIGLADAALNTRLPPQAARSMWGWDPLRSSAAAGTRRDAGFAAAGGRHIVGIC